MTPPLTFGRHSNNGASISMRDGRRISAYIRTRLALRFPGLPEQNYQLLCGPLHRALADRTKSFQYALRTKEILVSGPLTVVRLTWISTVTGSDGRSTTDDERAWTFQRSSDGS